MFICVLHASLIWILSISNINAEMTMTKDPLEIADDFKVDGQSSQIEPTVVALPIEAPLQIHTRSVSFPGSGGTPNSRGASRGREVSSMPLISYLIQSIIGGGSGSNSPSNGNEQLPEKTEKVSENSKTS